MVLPRSNDQSCWPKALYYYGALHKSIKIAWCYHYTCLKTWYCLKQIAVVL